MFRTLQERITQQLAKFVKKEDGVTLVEYALLLALIALVCIVAIVLVGQDASATLSTAAQSI
jgi:pilus assembly protein Flp/PilA